MADFLRTFALIAGTHALRMARARRMIVMGLLALVPAAPLVVISRLHRRGDAETLVAEATWVLLLQVVVPLVALIGGSAAAAEEISDRTITYVLVRPVSRAGFFLGRFVATLLSLELLLALSLLLVFLVVRHKSPEGTGLGSPIFWRSMSVVLAGGAVYASIFAALGAWVRHPMIVGLGYVFAIEGLLANFPGSSQALSLQYHLRSILVEGAGGHWKELITEAMTDLECADSAWRTLGWVFAIAIAAGMAFMRRRQAA